MQNVAYQNELRADIDVKAISVGTTKDMEDYIDANKNKTKLIVSFCTDVWNSGDINLPCKFQPQTASLDKEEKHLYFYSIMYNLTFAPNDFLSAAMVPSQFYNDIFKLKQDIDNSLLSFLHIKDRRMGNPPYVDITQSHFPIVTDRYILDANAIALLGALWLIISPLFLMVWFLTDIVKEKELNLRKGLNVIGMSHASYWGHWMATAYII
jgi:hypothetical protein